MHELKQPDKRNTFRHWYYFRTLAWTDKIIIQTTWFQSSRHANGQSSRVGSAEAVFREQQLLSLTVRVWCQVSRRHVIAPCFYSKTVNYESYWTDKMHVTYFASGNWIKRPPGPSKYSHSTYHTFSNGNMARLFWLLHYFSVCMASQLAGPIAMWLLSFIEF
jgi:hypothetical protein